MGFTINIFSPDGTPDGLRLVNKLNWSGACVVCPRAKFVENKGRDEFKRPGVYVLVGPSEDSDLPTIYVGEGDPILGRLEQHFAKKNFWVQLIAFTSKDQSLTKTHIQYLESKLVALARDAKRSNIDNGNVPGLPSITEQDMDWMEQFLEEMLLIYPLLGVSVFEKPKAAGPAAQLLRLSAKGVAATGYDSGQGFIVMKGSRAVGDTDVATSTPGYIRNLRGYLIRAGVLTDVGGQLLVGDDYPFDSPSAAAGVLLGTSVNGREVWKDENNRSLKEIQAAAVGVAPSNNTNQSSPED